MMPFRQRRLFALVIASAILLSGCANGPSAAAVAGTSPLISDTTIKISESTSISLEKLVYWGGYATVAYLVLDPLAPNWNIEEAAFPGNHYYLTLKMKRYYAGGAGEASMVFKQRAKALMLRAGFDEYRIVEYSESLDSSMLGSQRVAQGVIILDRKRKQSQN